MIWESEVHELIFNIVLISKELKCLVHIVHIFKIFGVFLKSVLEKME